MKKLLIYVSVVGFAVGVVYWLCKKGKFINTASKTADEKVDFESIPQEEEISRNSIIMEKMYQAKNESAQTVYERHTEASSIMKDAYNNIMEDFVEDFSDKSNTNSKGKNKEIVIDSESGPVMKEIDSISDELDNLLK